MFIVLVGKNLSKSKAYVAIYKRHDKPFYTGGKLIHHRLL